MSAGRSVAKRLLLTAVVAVTVVGLSGIVALLVPAGGGAIGETPEQEQWSSDEIVEDRVDLGGNANPRGNVGTVLFDRTHANRISDEGVASLVRAIGKAGGDVEYTGITTGFRPKLQGADVLVIVDPGTSYGTADLAAVDRFVDNGGRVVIFAEPNRKELQAQGFAVSVVTVRSKVAALGSEFGISFGTQYVYDMEHNDGNFKAILSRSPDESSAPAVEGVDRVSMYTATTVEVNRGQVLLRTHGTAERGNDDTRQGFPVAVLSNGGDVMAVGDKTFLSPQYHTVADNEVFVARIVEFMAGADHQRSGGGDGAPDDDGVDNGTTSVARPAD